MKHLTPFFLAFLLLIPGCTRFSSYLADMGSRCDGVAVNDPTIYRAGNKMYIKGQRIEYRNLTIPIWSPKGPDSKIVKIDGTEGETVYHEIKKEPGKPVSYTRTGDIGWTTVLPTLSRTDKKHNLDYTHSTGECHTDLHALWAYPAATLTFVAVDVPATIGIWCFMAASIPVLFINEQLED